MSIHSRFISCLHIPTFLFLLLLLGCDSKGVRLDGFVPGSNDGVSSLTTGDDNGCQTVPCTSGDWNNSYITPSSLTVAMKSAKLIKTTEPLVNPTPSYTIFDTGDASKPIISTFSPGTTQTFNTNTDFPAQGDYDRVQYEISYYEMVIPIGSSANSRVRLYLSTYVDAPNSFGSQQVFKSDILMTPPSTDNIEWIDPPPNSTNFRSQRLTTETGAYQVPTNQLDKAGGVDDITANNFTFTVPLATTLSVPADPKDQFTIQITFDTTKEFFFDDTNKDASCHDNTSTLCDANNSFNNTGFNFQLSPCPIVNGFSDNASSCDGRLDAKPKADFWPGLPAVTAEQK